MSSRIPKTQRAALVTTYGQDLTLKDDQPVVQPSELLPGQCLVKLEYTGICHTDLHTKLGDWMHKGLPRIAGHEGVGHVVAIGAHTANKDVKIGDRVGLKWIADVCLRCEMCRQGHESSCPEGKTHGYSIDGTFQEYAVSYVDHVTPIPPEIESAEAVCILCAGLTVWKALKESKARAGNWIVIPGAGGGLGHLAVQYAAFMGLRVVAIDTGEDKKNLAFKLGAEKFIDFRETKDIIADVKAACDGLGPHTALVTAASGLAYEQAAFYLRDRGTLVAVGMPAKVTLNIPIAMLVAKCISVVGTAIGSRQDAIEALDIAVRGKVRCHYELDTLENVNKVFDTMEQGKLVGRVVVKF